MHYIANILIACVALLHIAFMVLEMFLWNKPQGRKIFGLTAEFAERSATLAANQGLYNGFLAAGLIWSLTAAKAAFELKIFFLSCVIIAGIYGAMTVKRSIFWIQGFPAILALASLMLSGQ